MVTFDMSRAICKEASVLSVTYHVNCGRPAVTMLLHERDIVVTPMCLECTHHNVSNRGAKIVAVTDRAISQRENEQIWELLAIQNRRSAFVFRYHGGALTSSSHIDKLTEPITGETAKFYGGDHFICESLPESAARRIAAMFGAKFRED